LAQASCGTGAPFGHVAAMVALQSGRALLCLLTGGLVFHISRTTLAFSTVQLKTPKSSHAVLEHRGSQVFEPRVASQVRGGSASADRSLLFSLCGAAVATVAAERVLRVGMRSQGQGGRANFGQQWMPKVKGAKKMSVFRKKKNYGSASARQVPRRYKLYDILEELDETVPWYTVVSEPEEPKEPVWDVPLAKRYPWAGSLDSVPKEKKRLERASPMEPLFGSITGTQLPPTGRRQRYLDRKGWPAEKLPPWLNRPLIGTEVYVPSNMPFKKDRRPEPWQLKGKAREEAIQKRKEQLKLKEDKYDTDEPDDMDAELEAMTE